MGSPESCVTLTVFHPRSLRALRSFSTESPKTALQLSELLLLSLQYLGLKYLNRGSGPMGARDEMRVSAPCAGASSADGEGPAFLPFLRIWLDSSAGFWREDRFPP